MQYEKCSHCVNAGKMCQMIVAPALCALLDLNRTTNRALSYSRQRKKEDPPIEIKMDFTCLGFKQRENEIWKEVTLDAE